MATEWEITDHEGCGDYRGTYATRTELRTALHMIGATAGGAAYNKTIVTLRVDGVDAWVGRLDCGVHGADCDPVDHVERYAGYLRSARGVELAARLGVNHELQLARVEASLVLLRGAA